MSGRVDRSYHRRIAVHRTERLHLGPHLLRIHSTFVALNHIGVKSVLHVRPVLPAEQSLIVRFVFSEQQLRLASAKQPSFAILPVLQFGAHASWHAASNSCRWTTRIPAP